MLRRLFAVTTIVHCTSQQHFLCIRTLKSLFEEFSTDDVFTTALDSFKVFPWKNFMLFLDNGIRRLYFNSSVSDVASRALCPT
ncbi:hypothetical protein Zmor_000812 [Zophobas morio]|uniref:Uncharacterized protein n=1 Tax=Zophobas morio TaxID=2755281 RepID=A0AA38IX24_9CUCU|nr:hypothetical protein Zmor_000812 [Zophobas morio]